MDLTNSVNRAVLWCCVEDNAGLWELRWQVDSLLPMETEVVQKKRVEHIVWESLATGLTKLYTGKWGMDKLAEVPPQFHARILSENSHWNPPSIGEVYYCVGATEIGERLFFDVME